jgi:membrane-bound metal-dependent hydrolase YbcI (DUF457 family)
MAPNAGDGCSTIAKRPAFDRRYGGMYPSAHLAASLVLNEAYGGDRMSAAAGTIVPDLIDKTLAWVLGATPSARHAAHSLAAASVLTLTATRFGGRRKGASFGASYLCHLVCDLWEGGHVPWLMPFKRYRHAGRRWDLRITWRLVLLEVVGMLVLAGLTARWLSGDEPRLSARPSAGERG